MTLQKTELRLELKLKRLQHHPSEKKEKDYHIIQNIVSLPSFQKSTTILFYLPIHGEVDLTYLFEHNKLNKKFILPRVNTWSKSKRSSTLEKSTKKMHLHVITSFHDVKKGKFGILEPYEHSPEIEPHGVDLVLVPGIAFAENGHRIGYGQGFYDRLLKKVHCPKIGIAYEFQIVKNIDGDIHDVPMDIIITEKRIIYTNSNPSTS